MQQLSSQPTGPPYARLRTITAYTLLANVLVLTAIAASGALAPYVALHAVGGPRLVSMVLPPLPRFVAPLAGDTIARPVAIGRSSGVTAVRVASAGTAAAEAPAAPVAAAPLGPPAPRIATPARPSTATPEPTGLTPVGGEAPTVTPLPPTTDDPVTPPAPVVRPPKSKGHAYGVAKHSPKPHKSAKPSKPAKKKASPKKASPKKAAPKKAAPPKAKKTSHPSK